VGKVKSLQAEKDSNWNLQADDEPTKYPYSIYQPTWHKCNQATGWNVAICRYEGRSINLRSQTI